MVRHTSTGTAVSIFLKKMDERRGASGIGKVLARRAFSFFFWGGTSRFGHGVPPCSPSACSEICLKNKKRYWWLLGPPAVTTILFHVEVPIYFFFIFFSCLSGACRRRTPRGQIGSEGGVGEVSARRVFSSLQIATPSGVRRRHAPRFFFKKTEGRTPRTRVELKVT